MSESLTDKAKNLLINTFKTRDSAEKAYNSLLEEGYNKDDIYLVMSDETRQKHFREGDMPQHTLGEDIKDGSKAGSIVGGAVGAIAAAVMAAGSSVVIPGIGLVVAGPMLTGLAGLTGAAAGSMGGGMVGAMVGGGVHEAQAKEYEAAVKAGEILVGIKARSEEAYESMKKKWEEFKATI